MAVEKTLARKIGWVVKGGSRIKTRQKFVWVVKGGSNQRILSLPRCRFHIGSPVAEIDAEHGTLTFFPEWYLNC